MKLVCLYLLSLASNLFDLSKFTSSALNASFWMSSSFSDSKLFISRKTLLKGVLTGCSPGTLGHYFSTLMISSGLLELGVGMTTLK